MPKKSELPHKTCLVCGRPFAWRRKWRKDWEEVRYCSDRCRGAKQTQRSPSAGAAPEERAP